MKAIHFVIFLFCFLYKSNAQTLPQRLEKQVNFLIKHASMQHASLGLYVANAKTGEMVYAYNANTGLAPGSSQKVVTAATAFALLQSNYRFKTLWQYNGIIKNDTLFGNIYLSGYGDPTLGSWRYPSSKPQVVIGQLMQGLLEKNIHFIQGNIILNNSAYSYQPLPGGWIWDDIGNYYGAGTWALNWHENQYDIVLQPGKQAGDKVKILSTNPVLENVILHNFLKTGSRGSGDHAYIYLAPYALEGFVTGTVPAGVSTFTISGSFPNPAHQWRAVIEKGLKDYHIVQNGNILQQSEFSSSEIKKITSLPLLTTVYSPSLDSIVYWFLHKSINLYGEVLLKAFAYEQTAYGSTEQGLKILLNFWKAQGIQPSALKMEDGSGLSPQNRVTAKALTQVLQFAKQQTWFADYYKAFPIHNGLHIKSGTIKGAKSYAGYYFSNTGKQYAFAIIVNNFEGYVAPVEQLLFSVLNELKK